MKTKTNTSLFLFLFAALFIGLTACEKSEEIITEVEEAAIEVAVIDNSFTITNNSAELNKRMTLVLKPVNFVNINKIAVVPTCDNYTWDLVAEVASPIFDGSPLSASDIRIHGNKAYVTYHRQGEVYAGGVDVIDISDPENPTISSYMEFYGVDVNSLAIDDFGSEAERKVWLAASSFKKGAVLRQLITNNGLFSSEIVDISLSNAFLDGSITPSANGVAVSNDYIYMTAGNNTGGTFQLDRQTLGIIANEKYSDAKSIALNGVNTGDYQITLVGGDNAKLNVHRVGPDRSIFNSIPLGSIVHQNVDAPYLGKATISIRPGENVAFVALNQFGVGGINIETGELVYTTPSDMLTTGNTHGLAIDNSIIYVANSDDGLFIGCIPDEGGEITMIQQWDLDESGASANMVQTDGDWVFVAKGGGGLKILRKRII